MTPVSTAVAERNSRTLAAYSTLIQRVREAIREGRTRAEDAVFHTTYDGF